MGNLKLENIIENAHELKARKLDINDPVIKEMIADSIRAQEAILKLKEVSPESMRLVINI
jgi:hypothetical protein